MTSKDQFRRIAMNNESRLYSEYVNYICIVEVNVNSEFPYEILILEETEY